MKVKDLQEIISKGKLDSEAEVYLMDPTHGGDAAVMSATRACKNKDGSLTLITCGYVMASKRTQDYVRNNEIKLNEEDK